MYAKQTENGLLVNHTEQLDGFVEVKSIPAVTRNYRNAWALDGDKVVIDLEKAKPLQKQWAAQKAVERCPKDLRGSPIASELAKIDTEIEAIDWDAISTLDELYNTFPASIDMRNGDREYPL